MATKYPARPMPHHLTDPNREAYLTRLEAEPVRVKEVGAGRDAMGRYRKLRAHEIPVEQEAHTRHKPIGWARARAMEAGLCDAIDKRADIHARLAVDADAAARRLAERDARRASVPAELWERLGDGQRGHVGRWVHTGKGKSKAMAYLKRAAR
jgi:hypothetical protein